MKINPSPSMMSWRAKRSRRWSSNAGLADDVEPAQAISRGHHVKGPRRAVATRVVAKVSSDVEHEAVVTFHVRA